LAVFFKRRPKPYDRRKLLDAADKARIGGRKKKAISEYRKVLAVEPKDAQVHAKIAPLLAMTKQPGEALKSFELAARSFTEQGMQDKAIAVLAQATQHFPRHADMRWQLCQLQFAVGRKVDAVTGLVSSARHLTRKEDRPHAVRFLRRALEVDPLHVEATILLSKALAKGGDKAQAAALLSALVPKMKGRGLRKLRGAQLSLSPTPAAFFRYLAALF
jgi:thioredoxin-like negative regulator of GroEL